MAVVCQALGQTQSRLQIAQLVGEFLARLSVDEAEIAARFMVGRTLAQGEEKRLQVSGRAVWKIVATMTGGEDQSEDIFAAATDFGEAIAVLLELRPADPEPTLTISEVEHRFSEIAEIEGRNSRRRKLDALRGLLERASALAQSAADNKPRFIPGLVPGTHRAANSAAHVGACGAQRVK